MYQNNSGYNNSISRLNSSKRWGRDASSKLGANDLKGEETI